MISLAAFPPVLADNGDAIAAVVVFIITVVGWIAKLVGQRGAQAPPVARRPRPVAPAGNDRLQQEINIFLEDAGVARPAAPPRRPPRPQPPRPPERRPAPQAMAESSGKRKKHKKLRPGEELSHRPNPSAKDLGTGVQKHLGQHMSERVTQEVQQRLAPRVEQQVTADLGAAVAGGAPSGTPAARPVSPRADHFANLLRTPQGVQQAMVLNLILAPPPGLARSPRRG